MQITTWRLQGTLIKPIQMTRVNKLFFLIYFPLLYHSIFDNKGFGMLLYFLTHRILFIMVCHPGVADGNSGDYEEEGHLNSPDPNQSSSEGDYDDIANYLDSNPEQGYRMSWMSSFLLM